MITKIYALIWLFAIASGVAMFVTGGFSDTTITLFGFAISTLTFAGIIVVLPWWVDRRFTWKYQDG